ncbi:MAG TPA: MarR family transcriptional regulator [Hyphomicrobiales bacterium]|nr:MarR family transcriptional regulator [Hyphomicrobiales bacterium]
MHMLDANKLGALGTMIADRTEEALEGLSPSAAAALSMLHFKPGLTATGLARIIDISQPTAVRLIDGLERQGLLARGAPKGRTTPLVLTRAGRARVARLQARRLAVLDTLLGALPPDERQTFEGMLDRILAGATTSRAFARTTCRLCEHRLCGPEVCPIGCRAAEIEQAAEGEIR